jgi:hypothetical protein
MFEESEASPEARWDRLAQAFEAVESQPHEQRAPILDRLVGSTGATRRELDDMLAAADRRQELAIERRLLDAAAAAGASSVALGSRIGPWRVDALIGKGGMGEVYHASRVDGAFEQRVAIKVMRIADGSAIARPEQRFENERRIMARLEHPEIVPIIDGGRLADGRPYLVMPFVDAMPLKAHCLSRVLTLVERLALMARIARAVGHAHDRGVVHRDLKPSNILVGDDGRPHLLDFGIAKLDGDEHAVETVAGAPLLTPGYAAPEQGRGATAAPSADVYALGVMLDELVTPVDDERGRIRVVALEIARRAMDDDPDARFADANALARGLEELLEPANRWSRPRLEPKWKGTVALILFVIATLGLTTTELGESSPGTIPPRTITPIADTTVVRVIVPAVETVTVTRPVAKSRAVAVAQLQTLRRRALATTMRGRSGEAMEIMDSALFRATEMRGATSAEAASTRGQRAMLLLQGGDIDGARRELLVVDSIARRSHPASDSLLAKSNVWMGILALWEARPDTALALFQSAFDIHSRTSRTHPVKAMAACGMGLSLGVIGELDASAHWRKPYCHLQRRWGRGYDMLVQVATAGARRAGSTR